MNTPVCVAADGGPSETICPIAAHYNTRLAGVDSAAAASDAHWRAELERTAPPLLIVGTSDSRRGRVIEAAARRAARNLHVRIAAIEDFPGNYWHIAGAEADLTLVESAAARDICLRNLGAHAPRLAVVSPARYDRYRERLSDLRRHTASRWSADAPGRYRALWAGQPETEDCMRTLLALLPVLRALNVELLFKAHPQDQGYLSGDYRRTLDEAGIAWTDLTARPVEDALSAAPHVVVTQFSSVAVEAGFFGIPSLWILLADAGGARLYAKKGYLEPPLCAAGGALSVRDTAHCADMLRLALTPERRAGLIECFDRYFAVEQPGLTATVRILRALAA